jgi:hypothetical protein
MGKLSEIVFKPILTTEVESFGHKVTLRSLTSKDEMELNLPSIQEGQILNKAAILELAYKVLPKSIVNVDGIIPDNSSDILEFLQKQDSEVVFDLLSKHQGLTGITPEEIKN